MPRLNDDYVMQLKAKNRENADFISKAFAVKEKFDAKKHSRAKEIVNLRKNCTIEVLEKKDNNDAKRHARRISLM